MFIQQIKNQNNNASRQNIPSKTPKQYLLKNITRTKNTAKYKQPKKKETTQIPASLQRHQKFSSKRNKLQTSNFPSSMPSQEDTGKFGLMWPQGLVATSHISAKILNSYSTKGCTVKMNKNWSLEHILQALN